MEVDSGPSNAGLNAGGGLGAAAPTPGRICAQCSLAKRRCTVTDDDRSICEQCKRHDLPCRWPPVVTTRSALPRPAPAAASAPAPADAEAVDNHAESEDPVLKGLTTQEDAEALIDFFHQQLNPLLGLLDPNLHDSAYLRKKSNLLLFSAVLTAASKFSRPDLYEGLLQHARQLYSSFTSLESPRWTVAHVQSVIVLVYWRKAEDTEAFSRLATAIAKGFDLDWHSPLSAVEILPVTDIARRKVFDQERTWLCLVAMDREFTDVRWLVQFIRAKYFTDGKVWLQKVVALNLSVPSDALVAHNVSSPNVGEGWYDVDEEVPRVRHTALERMCQEFVAHEQVWLTGPNALANIASPTRQQITLLRWRNSMTVFELRLSQLWAVAEDGWTDGQPAADKTVADCVTASSTAVKQFEKVSSDDLVLYLTIAPRLVAETAYYLYHVHKHAQTPQRLLVLEQLEKLRTCCSALSERQHGGQYALCAGFIDRVIHVVRHRPLTGNEGIPRQMKEGPGHVATSRVSQFLRTAFGNTYRKMFEGENQKYLAPVLSA